MADKTQLQKPQRYDKFWLAAGILAVLLAVVLARDITRPFTGLHSWAQASGACVSRAHARYGLGYTKGVSTWAVGEPPPKQPKRYWDHPQLSGLLGGLEMKIFGINEWSRRLVGVFSGVLSLLMFLKIMRGLVSDEKEALLAALVAALFPLTGYFGLGGWLNLAALTAIWSYLVIIRELRDSSEPRLWHKIILAVSLFLGLQLSWLGFFYAFAIGSHYVIFKCLLKKRMPDWSLLSILFFAPVLSLLVTFTIMAAGYNWDIGKIVELYKWRSAKGEMQQMQGFDWGAWFSKLWEFSVQDFTVPVLLLVLFYFTFGQLLVFTRKPEDDNQDQSSRRFPQFWLFVFPAILFLLVFRGLIWRHQYWLRPLLFPMAIASAMAVLLIGDVIRKINRRFGIAVMVILVGVIAGYCIAGTNYFHSIRWQPQEKIDMFEKLNERIPPDKSLLSFEDFIVNQHKSKGGFIRPEIAWYLDRPIDKARSFEQIQQKAKTDEYPVYLMPYHQKLAALIKKLQEKYKYEYVHGVEGKRTEDGEFLKAGMMPYMIFDLKSKN
jgi:hypothetical protein